MKLRIVTPERIVMSQEVDSVTVPTTSGEITILKNHIPLVSNMLAGELRILAEGQEEFFAVSGGFVEVRPGNEIVVLADTAEFGHEIDLERAEKARQDAEKLMRENYANETSAAEAIALLERNMARLRVGQKHRTRTNKNLESGTFHQ